MPHYRTILYPVDLAVPAGAIRAPAFELSRSAERLRILYVDSLFGSADHVQQARRSLEAIGTEAPCEVEVVVTHALAPGPVILQHAAAPDVDLVAMGTHGRKGLARFLLGSAAREVVQNAPCPVLTALPGADDAVLPTLVGVPVLVAIDFSDASAEAVRQAADLAQMLRARVDLLHVASRVDLEARTESHADGSVSSSEHTVRVAKKMQVDSFARAALKGTPHEGETPFGDIQVESGAAADVIVRAAEARASGLLVLGTKGLHGVGHLVAGSVAEAVVRDAPCPVLTVKTPDSYAALRAHLTTTASRAPS